MSQTETIIFFDDDDQSYPERSAEHLYMHGLGADISYVSSTKYYNEKYSTKAINSKENNLIIPSSFMVKKLLLGYQSSNFKIGWIPSSTLAIKKEKLIAISGFNESYMRLEDADLAIRAAKANYVFSWSDKILVNRKSTSSDKKGGNIEMIYELKLLNEHGSLLKREEVSSALYLIKIRSLYFQKKYFQLILALAKNLSLSINSVARFKNLFQRGLHDFRKR